MYYGIYKLAEVVVAISFRYKENAERFEPFRVAEKPVFEISLTEDRIKEELVLLRSVYPDCLFEKKDAEFNALYRDVPVFLWKKGVLLVHGVLLEMDGMGFLFSAPSGTGKSYHAKKWTEVFPSRVTVINGDKPLLRMANDAVYGYGSPWMGKERIGTNTMVKLNAICRISRGEKNVICQVSKNEFYINWLLEETMLKNRQNNILQLVRWYKQAIQYVSIFKLKCNMDPNSAIVSYHGMRG